MRTDMPIITNVMMPVTRCSLNAFDEVSVEREQGSKGGGRAEDAPYSDEVRHLSRRLALALHLQRVDVVDGEHSGGHVDWQTKEPDDEDQDRQHKQVQMVAASLYCDFTGQPIVGKRT